MSESAHGKLWARFTAVIVIVSTLVCVAFFTWSIVTQYQENSQRALEQARVLSAEIDATWDYINSVQDTINYTDGEFTFKRVYCAVAGKDIAQRFSRSSDYGIRYVRENPRNEADQPDEFESEALAALDAELAESNMNIAAIDFRAGGNPEYYDLRMDDGELTFRYVMALVVDDHCLVCHGDEKGETDLVGYYKEGMQYGDLAGGVSISIPMSGIAAQTRNSVIAAILFFIVLIALDTFIVRWALRRWVTTPIEDENRQLRDESEIQSNFLATVTHELKTPLSAIVAYTDKLKRHLGDDPAENLKTIEEIELNGSLLRSMIDNVLDAARVEAGAVRLSMDDLDVYDIANLVRASAGPIAAKDGINFRVSVEPGIPVVRTDREMLRRVTLNLVANALRFTPRGGTVELRMSYADGKLRVEVQDSGCGIEPERIDGLFERFATTDGSARSGENGTGLGLFIVKSFADMLGGTVHVDSQLGVGSTFSVVLPMEACDEGE